MRRNHSGRSPQPAITRLTQSPSGSPNPPPAKGDSHGHLLPAATRSHAAERALVVAGSGAAGNAWQLGLIAGIADAGVDLAQAELVIGTSAGSTVTAQITSRTRDAELYAAILAEVPPPPIGMAGHHRHTRPLSGARGAARRLLALSGDLPLAGAARPLDGGGEPPHRRANSRQRLSGSGSGVPDGPSSRSATSRRLVRRRRSARGTAGR